MVASVVSDKIHSVLMMCKTVLFVASIFSKMVINSCCSKSKMVGSVISDKIHSLLMMCSTVICNKLVSNNYNSIF